MTQSPRHRPITAKRLVALRADLARHGLAGFVVPHADEHQSEYLPASAERLAWLTGFTGSAGIGDRARRQGGRSSSTDATRCRCANEVDGRASRREHLIETPPAKWLAAHVKAGDRIGYDPWLMTVAEVRRFGEACAAAGAEFVAVDENPIDALWTRPAGAAARPGLAAPDRVRRRGRGDEDRPAASGAHREEGRRRRADAGRLRSPGRSTSAAATSRTIRWRSPLRSCRAEGQPKLFIDGRKLSNSRPRRACRRSPTSASRRNFGAGARRARRKRRQVLLDPQTTAERDRRPPSATAGGTIVEGADPVVLPKARKNATEIAGARARAHPRRRGDGALPRLARRGRGRRRRSTRSPPPRQLEAFRAETARRDGSELIDISFDTISGAGPNGAIVHYRVTPETSRKLEAGHALPGRFRRRSIATAPPTSPAPSRSARRRRRCATASPACCKGHIALATARFPAGTTGAPARQLARVAALAGRPRLRPRHRPRRRLVSLGA